MAQEDLEVIRALWATLDREPGVPWPSLGPELDRRLRLDLLDEQVELRNPREFPVPDEYQGHDGVRQWAVEVWEVFSELHNDLEEIIEVGDETLITVQKTHGRMRHTQLETRFRWATVWKLRDGKVLRVHGYATKAQALEAAGVEAY